MREAKLAIKELKLHKKQLGVTKKALTTRIAELWAEYRQDSARRGSMMRGGGGLGKFVRIFQRANRDASRVSKENAIAPLEQEKMKIERIVAGIDGAVIKLEKFIIDNS